VPTDDDAFNSVPPRFYTHHPQRGETVHRSEPESIHRELRSLDVPAGARVLEIGTGSGYSSALLAELVGPDGTVVSVDVDPHLVGWANLLHHQRGLTTVACHHADGMTGYPPHAPYDRIAAWCTPPRLPRTWIDQLTPGGRIVACLPIAALPSTTVIATIVADDGQPRVQDITFGGYAQSTVGAVADVLTVPPRWVDWCIPHPAPSWIAIAWRADDDWLHTGARTALEQLLNPGHTETYKHTPVDWRSWTVYTAALDDPHLSVAALRGETRGIGHCTPTTAAVIQTDGTIIADNPDSPSLIALRTWLEQWEQDSRPTASSFTAALVEHRGPDLAGWDLRIRQAPAARQTPTRIGRMR
jgi:protein-L-isoaspartate(D-aspartate) O-methyltransferase